MGKYAPLTTFLRGQRTREVPMTFREIEGVVGMRLPESARRHRAWWSNSPSNSVLTEAWLQAGFESSQVDMAGEKLTFRRRGPEPQPAPAKSGNPVSPADGNAEDHSVHHPLWGSLKGMMKIMPGTDLTQPADPDWGKD